MKNVISIGLIVFINLACFSQIQSKKNTTSNFYQTVTLDTLFNDKIQIRAIAIDSNKVWYAGDEGRFGFYNFKTNTKWEDHILFENLKMEFRSIAQTSKYIYILNVSNPALLYWIDKETKQHKLVYQENDPKVFYDSMQFWNDKEGIAIGDPVSNCLSIIVTHDGGNSWQKIACNQLPEVVEGEAAFAASNTNIVIKGNHTWIVSGGKKSRVYYSPDKGNSWEVFETPIVQGKEMTGIFTADFYNEKLGFVAGGDYEVQEQNFGNKAFTNDGGKTWKLIAENQGFGHSSCIQYIPNSDGKELVSVGKGGIYYSADSGSTWKLLSTYPYLFTLRFIDNKTAIGAGYKKMIQINFKK